MTLHRIICYKTFEFCTTCQLCPVLRFFERSTDLDFKTVAAPFNDRLNVCFIFLLLGKAKAGDERDIHIAKLWLEALAGSCPKPCNHRQGLANIRFLIRTIDRQILCDFYLGIQMSDLLLGFFPHPVTVTLDIPPVLRHHAIRV